MTSSAAPAETAAAALSAVPAETAASRSAGGAARTAGAAGAADGVTRDPEEVVTHDRGTTPAASPAGVAGAAGPAGAAGDVSESDASPASLTRPPLAVLYAEQLRCAH